MDDPGFLLLNLLVGKDPPVILHGAGEVFISGIFPVGLTALCRTDLVSACIADFLFKLKMSR